MNRPKRNPLRALATGLLLSASICQAAPPSKQAALMTKWAAEVNREAPWPDYPRPQMVRTDWLNLNGTWEYQSGAADDATPVGKKLSGEILVPFAVESALSGVMEHHDRLWYRRSFTVPAEWAGRNVVLNFGAVDFESEVFINGASVGVHKGGYLPFGYDVTKYLKGPGPQELIVRVFDPTDDAGLPRGKQSLHPGGIMYTPTTGIWQTVWLEPVAPASIQTLKIVPDIDASTLKLTVNVPDAPDGVEAHVTIRADDKTIQTVNAKPNTEISIPIPDAKLWSPKHPFLYDIQASLTQANNTTDTVKSYFGMRKISIGEENGIKKMFLNNKFVFEIGPLDQGFWPDGIYTPPTESALKADIQMMKDFGFNMVRKHIKVEPARWYYWTDKMGLLVWQDMPSANSYTAKHPPVDKEEYEKELRGMVAALMNVPSIIMWDTYNEGQGQFDTARLVGIVKELDPSRLVNQASGGGYFDAGDVYDIHSYPPPNCPQPSKTQALACGEYGGIGMVVHDHLWKPAGRGYTNVTSSKDLEDEYGDFANMLKSFRDDRGMSAAVYTQITDVETEVNGLMTYDRILKCDVAQIAKANRFEYPVPTYNEVVPTSEKSPQVWKYTTDTPAKEWSKTDFDDSSWKSGPGGFGAAGMPNASIGTQWTTADIWIRRVVKIGELTPDQIHQLVIRDFHDDGINVLINGVSAFNKRGFIANYEYQALSPEAKAAIKPGADNVIAVHCHQTTGGQFVDVGLFERIPGK